MPRTDLLEQSPTRVELDQRSRETRLRLEQVERLLVLCPLPRASLLMRVLRCLGPRAYVREQIGGRSASSNPGGEGRRLAREMPSETEGAADGVSAASSVLWSSHPRCVQITPISSNPATSGNVPTAGGLVQFWGYQCGQGDLDSRTLN